MSETPSSNPAMPDSSGPQPIHVGSVARKAPSDRTEIQLPVVTSIAKSAGLSHLLEFSEDLRAITTTTEQHDALIKNLLECCLQRARILGMSWVEFSGGSASIMEAIFKNTAMDNQASRQLIVSSSILATQERSPQVVASDHLKGTIAVCVPVFKDETTSAVFCGVFAEDKSRSAESLAICQNVANHYDLWRSRDQMTAMAVEVRSAATVLELVGKAECSETVKEASVKIANELQQFFRCDYVAVGVKQKNASNCKLMAVSSLGEYDAQSRTTTLIKSAFDEATLRGTYTSYPESPDSDSGSSLSHKKLARHLRCETAITMPLSNQSDETIGAITILGSRGLGTNPNTVDLIRSFEHPIGSCLEIVKSAEGGWLKKIQRTLAHKENANVKKATLAIMAFSIIALMIPITYRVPANCTAEPVNRSFGVAPHDGLLENTFVEPGDIVKRGQILAQMDGREIGFQIADAVAKKNRAAKAYDSHLANKETAETIQAELEHLGFAAELKVLEHKRDNLQIKSKIEGIVLSGSIDKRQNFPVSLGQTLYEIAPISPLRVELAVSAEEVMHIQPGQKVKFRFDGFGTQTMVGKIEVIRPSSTIRDDENVFIAEAVLPNENGKVRPGMNGKARIYTSRKTLGWTLFHRPWEKIVHVLGF
jgi:multidrug resistance efflux pump